MDLKEAMYISLKGYGPESMYTLEDWLKARALFRANQEAAYKLVSVPKIDMK